MPSQTPATAASDLEPVSPLSHRIYLLQQLLPFLLLVVVMIYELTRHLIFPDEAHPSLLAVELVVFGITGPAALWLTLNWIGREIKAREAAEGEADTRSRMMMEMHHRIKNNLQTVADLLTLEMARTDARPPTESLRDSVARIKSIAAAHELLSLEWVGAVEVTELARRVGESARSAMTRPGQSATLTVDGPAIYLPSKAATSFALVINELVSNAMEHGLAGRADGLIEIWLEQGAGALSVQVRDNGAGLPPGFDLRAGTGLGLKIVRNLIEKDMRGTISITEDGGACVDFSIPVLADLPRA
ncbi:MAG: sensor histidine kinase [Chloroflexi bacterium]|nr:sensor histidine kinase [Chloroflexota bacterium]